LGDAYRLGALWGMQAGLIEPLSQKWDAQITWTTFVRGYYLASQDIQVVRILDVSELSLDLILRRKLWKGAHARVGGGGRILLSNQPLRDTKRLAIGWSARVGIDIHLFGEWSLLLDTAYAADPQSVSLIVGFAAGL